MNSGTLEVTRDETVFIVDDEFPHADAAREILERAGWDVVGLECDIEKGKKEIEKVNPNIVLLDIRFAAIPDAGFELAEAIRRRPGPENGEVPFIVFLTGHGNDETRDRARRIPASLYLTKPIKKDELVATIENAGKRWNHIRDAQWALTMLESTGFADRKGDYVAIFNREVIDDGDNEEELQRRAGEKLNVDPARVVIEYKGGLP